MAGRSYQIEMKCSIGEADDGSWFIELRVNGIRTYTEAVAISKWIRGSIHANGKPGTEIPLEPQQ